jgi:hypothetical protein
VTAPPPADREHAGDLVSAHLDGELDPATDAWVRAHLDGCASCRTAAAEARTAKEWLRSLPAIDATPLVSSLLDRHRAIIRTGAAFVSAAAVVLGALALTSAVLRPDVVPDVDALASAHDTALSGPDRAAGVAGRVEAAMVSAGMDQTGLDRVDRVGRPYAAPPAMIGNRASLSRQGVFDGEDLTVVVYGDGETAVSVYQQPGRLDWDRLPTGTIEAVADRRVWVREADPTVMITEVGDLVITVVSDDRAAMRTVVDGLPERRRNTTWHRLHDASARFVEVFVLAG